jgi:hypothetical protein
MYHDANVGGICIEGTILKSPDKFFCRSWTGRSLLVIWRELLWHIATNVPENDVDGCGSQSLELSIVLLLTDSCQSTV